MGFPRRITTAAMISCGRCCCLCHRFVDVQVQCHHIKPQSKGGRDTKENCIPLCLSCHARVEHYNDGHPIGTKFTSEELCARRDHCYELVRIGTLPMEPNQGTSVPVLWCTITGYRQ